LEGVIGFRVDKYRFDSCNNFILPKKV